MSEAEFVSRHLSGGDNLDSFRSGQPSLDEWLGHSARHAEGMRSGRTWVWVDLPGAVVVYFTLAGHVIETRWSSRQVASRVARSIPAVPIARLGLDQSLQGRGLGGVLLTDALSRIVTATEIIAARFVVVDAIDARAADFCAHYDFQVMLGVNRLVRKISDIAAEVRP